MDSFFLCCVMLKCFTKRAAQLLEVLRTFTVPKQNFEEMPNLILTETVCTIFPQIISLSQIKAYLKLFP